MKTYNHSVFKLNIMYICLAFLVFFSKPLLAMDVDGDDFLLWAVSELTLENADGDQVVINSKGPVTIEKSATQNEEGTIDIELVALDLISVDPVGLDPVQIIAGRNFGLPATKGEITGEPSGPFLIDSFFDVFFDIVVDGETLRNKDPVRLETTTKIFPPFGSKLNSVEAIDLFDSNGNPAGTIIDLTLSFPPDHYRSYLIKSKQHKNHELRLSDQFNDKPIPYVVQRPVRLLNPALKRHNNKEYPAILLKEHLVGYKVKGPKTKETRRVLVKNQFGKYNFRVFEADLLLVPSLKCHISDNSNCFLDPTTGDTALLPGFNIDHFLCYKIMLENTDFSPIGGIFVEDQFDDKTIALIEPVRLCNPVQKTRKIIAPDGTFKDEITRIKNPEGHLLCYQSKTGKHISRKLEIFNQFEKKRVKTAREREFCVPSIKKLLF